MAFCSTVGGHIALGYRPRPPRHGQSSRSPCCRFRPWRLEPACT